MNTCTVNVYKALTPAQLAAVVALQSRGFGDDDGYHFLTLASQRHIAEQQALLWLAPRFGAGFVVGCALPQAFLEQWRQRHFAYASQPHFAVPVAALAQLNAQLQRPIELLSAHGDPSRARQLERDATRHLAQAS